MSPIPLVKLGCSLRLLCCSSPVFTTWGIKCAPKRIKSLPKSRSGWSYFPSLLPADATSPQSLLNSWDPADSPSHLGVVYLWCHTSVIAYDLIAFLLPHWQGKMWANCVDICEASSFTCAGGSHDGSSFSQFKGRFSTNHKVGSANCTKFANTSNKVCSLKVRLHPNAQQGRSPGANIVHQSIRTQPYRWPCVGRFRGQSTIIVLVLHFSGRWWWRRWRGCGAAMITHTLHGRAGWVPLPGNRLHHHGHYLPLQRLPHKTEQAVTAAHATSLGGKKPQCEGRDSVEQPLLTVPELRAAAALSSNFQPVPNQPSEGIGRTSLPRSAGSPMQPQLEETNTNVADVSPPHAGRNPPFILKKKKKGRREARTEQTTLTRSDNTPLWKEEGRLWVFQFFPPLFCFVHCEPPVLPLEIPHTHVAKYPSLGTDTARSFQLCAPAAALLPNNN